MCGIAGMISKRNKLDNIEDIDRMLDAQRHRGPDDYGIASFRFGIQEFLGAKCSSDLNDIDHLSGIIGHNRLSILDLSMSGHQPMISEDGKCAIVYNGEVYNAFDFKDELIKDGVNFKSSTDTEIILYLYIKYGIDKTLQILNGMFAFCIVDLTKQKIFFARDRVGIKPLYYYDDEEEIVFASELKSILARNSVKREIDLDAVEEYFSFRSPSAASLIKGVAQVGAGEYLELDSQFHMNRVKWFDVNVYSREEYLNKGYEELISESVNKQMISDVKVGCQLSGGIDSSLVSYYAKKTGYKDAISIVFNDKSFSEDTYIDFVTEHLKIQSHKKKLDSNYVIEHWERMNWYMDGIVNHPNSMGIMALAEEAKKHVTVLLSGEGADETAGGYSNFMAAYIMALCERKSVLATLFKWKYKRLLQDFTKDKTLFFFKSHGYTEESILNRILKKRGTGKYRKVREKRLQQYTGTTFDKMIKYDIEFYLPELLKRQDRMTMSYSIENRVPLLDNSLLDFLLRCNEKLVIGWKIPNCLSFSLYNFISGKKVMKKLSEKIYGKNFTYRKKSGFALPLQELFEDKKFLNYIHKSIIPAMEERDIINSEYVKECLNHVDEAKQEELELLWRMLSFETWCQLFIDGRQTKTII